MIFGIYFDKKREFLKTGLVLKLSEIFIQKIPEKDES